MDKVVLLLTHFHMNNISVDKLLCSINGILDNFLNHATHRITQYELSFWVMTCLFKERYVVKHCRIDVMTIIRINHKLKLVSETSDEEYILELLTKRCEQHYRILKRWLAFLDSLP